MGKTKKKGKQKEPITYVGQPIKNWRQQADENIKRSIEYIKKHNIKKVPTANKDGKKKGPKIDQIVAQLPKRGKELIGHLNVKPLYSINGCAPAVVTDEMKNPKVRTLNCKLSASKGK